MLKATHYSAVCCFSVKMMVINLQFNFFHLRCFPTLNAIEISSRSGKVSHLYALIPPRGGHLYFRLDIILVKGFSKHTVNTYFSGMKEDPKYAFLHALFLICSFCHYDQIHTPFSNFARFCTPKQCMRVHCLVLKNNPNYVNFFSRMISNFIQVAPLGSYHNLLHNFHVNKNPCHIQLKLTRAYS